MALSSKRDGGLGIMRSCTTAGDAYIYWGASKGHRSEGLDHPHSHRHHQFNS